MGVNKVVKGNEVMLDLTEDTVTENNLLAGATAHNAAGEAITGAVVVAPIDSELSETSENPVQNKVVKQAIDNKADKSLYGNASINLGRRPGTLTGIYSTAEGDSVVASGEYSHAEGSYTVASGKCSHAGGKSTEALHNNEVAYGSYNQSNDDTLFSIGDGTAASARHNAFEITATGGKLHDKDIATTDLIPTKLPASDVKAWAKADTKPEYTWNEILNKPTGTNPHGTTKADVGLSNVGNFKAVSTVANQSLTNTEKANARNNIGAGTSSFSGSYNDLTNKPTIPNEVTESTVSGWGFTKNKSTEISGTTDTNGNIRFSAVSNNKVPLFVAINNLFCTPFISGSSYYVHIENKSGVVASTAVSGNIYYVQL